VLNKLASSIGRRDEVPNQELAKEIIRSRDKKAVKELVENLSNSDSDIQGDCIKVLYEVGEKEPKLIAEHAYEFGRLLQSKNNRLFWGGMTALDTITLSSADEIHALLPAIMAAGETGSVIARDHAMGIIVKLAQDKRYSRECLPHLMQQLRTCPDNQFPMYAEMSMPVINQQNKKDFLKIFDGRRSSLKKDSQKKRVDKLLRKMSP
jgi:hypothetical protein